jgi:hypothetical protein
MGEAATIDIVPVRLMRWLPRWTSAQRAIDRREELEGNAQRVGGARQRRQSRACMIGRFVCGRKENAERLQMRRIECEGGGPALTTDPVDCDAGARLITVLSPVRDSQHL